MNRMLMVLAFVVAVLDARMSNAQAPATLPARRVFPLDDVMWQPLPSRIANVSIGPDDRIWYELAPFSRVRDLANVKRLIEREFTQPDPQLCFARVALFEPNGRVWFVHDGRYNRDNPVTLLG